MSKLKLKRLITLTYSAVISGLFCLGAYFFSLRVTYQIKETIFLIGLFLVLVGIFILISRNPNKVSSVAFDGEEDTEDKSNQEGNLFLFGFNGFTVVLTGVFLLIIGAFL